MGDRPGVVLYEDEVRALKLPLARVDSVGVIRRDTVKTLFYGAGAAAAGYLVYELLDSDNLNEHLQQGSRETADRRSDPEPGARPAPAPAPRRVTHAPSGRCVRRVTCAPSGRCVRRVACAPSGRCSPRRLCAERALCSPRHSCTERASCSPR